MSRALLALAIVPLALSAPASAATWAFGGSNGNFATVTATGSGLATITAQARRFTVLPDALTNISQLTTLSNTGSAMQINRTAPGIGVRGGASTPQIDTNSATAREAILLTSSKALGIQGLKLSYIDANDTLQVYGVNTDGSLMSLGFGGNIISGLGGAATFANTGANDGTTNLTFVNNAMTAFNRYVFTTRVGGDVRYGGDFGQGYRIDGLTATVPEPTSWAMLIAGFGLIGGLMRRQRRLQDAALA